MFLFASVLSNAPQPIQTVPDFEKRSSIPLSLAEAGIYIVAFWGVLFRLTKLAEWLHYFNNLAVGEAAAPGCFCRENAEGAGMPPLLIQ
jgi:hypothetical protein